MDIVFVLCTIFKWKQYIKVLEMEGSRTINETSQFSLSIYNRNKEEITQLGILAEILCLCVLVVCVCVIGLGIKYVYQISAEKMKEGPGCSNSTLLECERRNALVY